MSYVPETVEESPHLDELTPREIVRELDKYVIGQAGAKRAVAIALRNRIRRQKLPPEMAEEVMPNHHHDQSHRVVGKSHAALQSSRFSFLKVEASKFTEVDVGRDVESMIRDLVEISIDMVRNEKLEEVADKRTRTRKAHPDLLHRRLSSRPIW
jgi:ATP-dependent HslUV protease ATP-binding subunit HslU